MELGTFKLELDKRWELNEFSVFTKEYAQVYNFFYILELMDENERFALDVSTYPWEGGYSVYNFFRKLSSYTPKEHRPHITRLEYASPGFIELAGIIDVAKDISILIGMVSTSLLAINQAYHSMYKSYKERQLARLKVKRAEIDLNENDTTFVKESVEDLCKRLGFKDRHKKALVKLSHGNYLIQLKILLALYRRSKTIAENQALGKTKV